MSNLGTHSQHELRTLISAINFAAQKHSTQRRKDAEQSPYINHPVALLDVLANEGDVDDIDVLCAAVLHDVIEDCAANAAQRTHLSDELRRRFGDRVLAIVAEVTDDKDLPKAERKRLQIEHAAHLTPGAKLVKMADKIVNLRDVASSPPADWSIERRREYFDWARAVVDAMVDKPRLLSERFDGAFAARP